MWGCCSRARIWISSRKRWASVAGDDLRAQDLDRDGAVVLAVARQVDHGHPAPAQLSVDRVAVAHRDRLEHGLVTSMQHAES